MVVGQSNSEAGMQAFRWEQGENGQSGVMHPLGVLPGGVYQSIAEAVSLDGRIIVGKSASRSGPQAFRWEDGEMVGLGDLPRREFRSSAYAVSSDGSVIVGRGVGRPGLVAFRWDDEGMKGLGFSPVPYAEALAHWTDAGEVKPGASDSK